MLRKISTLALVTLALLSVDAQKNKNTQYNDGVEKIVEIELTEAEKEKFATAAAAVREVNGDLKF